MKFTKQVTINAPADKVWEVLARDFADTGTWATAVSSSVAHKDVAPVNNSHVGGRVCQTDFGEVNEDFTAYDDQNKTFSYKGDIKSKILKNVTNSAEVISQDENTTLVKITPEIGLSFIGMFMAPMLKMKLSKLTDEVLDDLKYYVENGKPSPRKLASQKK